MTLYANTLRDENTAKPIAGATVYVYGADGQLSTDLTDDLAAPLANPLDSDEFGNFSFNAPDGFYTLDFFFGGRRMWKENIILGVVPLDGAKGLLATSRAALQAITGQSAGQSALLGEFGRVGIFVWSSFDVSAQVTADPQQGVYVPPASDPTGASGAWVRKFDGPVYPEWFGAKGDAVFNNGSGAFVSGTNDYTALNAALTYLRGISGGSLNLNAWYRSDSQLTWDDATVAIVGRGASLQPNAGSGIYFPNSASHTGCIRIKNGPAGKGSGSTVRGVTILGANGTAVSAANAKLGLGSGLLVQCQGHFQDVIAMKCEGNGIYALSSPSSADVTINCNGSKFDYCFGYACGNNGRASYGVDSNALVFTGGGALQNTQFGDYWNGLEGSKVVGPDLEGNFGGLVRIGDLSSHNEIEGATAEGPSYLVQIDAGGGGLNEIKFATAGGAVTFTDNSGMGTNKLVEMGVLSVGRFGRGNSTIGYVVLDAVAGVDVLLGRSVRVSDTPLTTFWSFNCTGGNANIFTASLNSLYISNGNGTLGSFQSDGLHTIDLNLTGVIKKGGTQVVGARDTGWAADTGTAKKTATATYVVGSALTVSATYVQAEHTAIITRQALVEAALRDATQEIKALKDALITHGLIGA